MTALTLTALTLTALFLAYRRRAALLRWVVWSPTRTIAVGTVACAVLGMGVATSLPDLAPQRRPAPQAVPSPAVPPLHPSPPSPASPAAAAPAVDHTDELTDPAEQAVLATARTFADRFVNAGQTSEQVWRRHLLETADPSLHPFLAAASHAAAPRTSVVDVTAETTGTYDATVNVDLADGTGLRIGLVYDGQRWLVDEYQRSLT